MLTNSTILVTGGSGFIGNHLCRFLLSKGHKVICIDNNFTGSLKNINDLLENPKFKFIKHDITKELFMDNELDEIYHLACPASPKAYQFNAIKTIKTNIMGTINVLGIAKKKNARILLTSTSEVYGNPNESPQREEYWGNVNPIGIRSCYDEGKRVAETLMMDYHRQHKVDIRIARIFNTYGPNMDPEDGRVISNFINQCLKNEDITIYGDGSQTRSFCYIDDMINGLVKLMETNNLIGPINLGNPDERTIKEIAELIKTLIPTSVSKLIFKPLPMDDPMIRKPDITKAKQLLGWSPSVKTEDGLLSTICYFDEKIKQ